jgi:hypothetical protein
MSESQDDKLDRAVSRRLARLRSHPVDLSGIESRLSAEIPAWTARRFFSWRVGVIALAAAAAGVFLMLAVQFVLLGRPQGLSVTDLASIHAEVTSAESHAVPVENTAEINRALKVSWAGAPVVSEVGLPVHSCCVHVLGGRKLACIRLSLNGKPVTAAICRASDIQVADWPAMMHDGMPCRCCSMPDLKENFNAVATQRNGIVILMFGAQSRDELLNAINQIHL